MTSVLDPLAPTAVRVPPATSAVRVDADGKHLTVGAQPFRVKGVTYGTFAPRRDGALFPPREVVDRDFAAIASLGLNTVRTYTLPPEDVLDTAADRGLRVIVGIDYHDWRLEPTPSRAANRRIFDAGRSAVAAAVERCTGRPEVIAISVGNEVPSDVVRVHGIKRIERVLGSLVAEVHERDGHLLATYTNYPSTEYLEVEGQDLVSFNVFLERREQLRPYLRHLQVLSGDVPLLISELGLSSTVHGEEAQADCLEWQLRLVDEAGCAGATVFAWTDEWAVAGQAVEGWGFGLTDAQRRPRRSAQTVARWAESSIADARDCWPTMSVVVCAYNAESTIDECLASLSRSDYPDLEVIVCDDGSKDRTAEIASRYRVRVIQLYHGGLSAARNAGTQLAHGEIVAFLDADAACHREWPYHLALSLEDEGVGGTGGPNLPVAGVRFVERAVAACPGGPVEVLLSDDRAEHVPGCNMAYRKSALQEIGGFDPELTTAGDDVDVCWKLLDAGYEIAYSPAAQVRHHRRSSLRAYLKQQRGYGKAERIVADHHRHRFNALGQARWSGFIYGGPRALPGLLRPVIYHGPMGLAPFQKVLRRPAEAAVAWATALLPLSAPLLVLALLAFVSRWFLVGPAVTLAAWAVYAAVVGAGVRPPRGERRRLAYRLVVGALHVAQPLARAWGRLCHMPALRGRAQPAARDWRGDRSSWLDSLERDLLAHGCRVRSGREHDSFDLEVTLRLFTKCRVTTAVVWSWQPLHRIAMRPRLHLAVALAAAGALAVISPVYGGIAAAAVAAVAAFDALWLSRHVRHAIRRTIARAVVGAGVEGVPASDAMAAQNGAAGMRFGRDDAKRTAGRRRRRTRGAGETRRERHFGVIAFRERPSVGNGDGPAPAVRSEPEPVRRYGNLVLYRRLMREARPYWPHIAALFAVGMLATPITLLTPLPLKIAVDSVVGSHPAPAFLPSSIAGGTALLVAAALLFVVVALLDELQKLANSVLGTYTGEKLQLAFRARLFAHLQKLSLGYHDSQGTADAVYRIEWDAQSIQWLAVYGITPFASAALMLVGMIYVTSRISWQLAAIAAAACPILFFFMWVSGSPLRGGWRRTKSLESSAMSIVQEVLTGLRVVKAFGQEDREHDRFVETAGEGMRARIRLAVIQGAFSLLVGLTIATASALVLYVGVNQVENGTVTVGGLILVMGYLVQLYVPLRLLTQSLTTLQESLAGAERAFSILEKEHDVPQHPDARSVGRAAGAVRFESVSFEYEPGERVLEKVSFEVGPGARVGIEGATGAGKTTLVSLLMRFHDPTEGRVLLDDVDARQYVVADLRNQFGIVLQEPVLFSTSIAENIAYAKPGASRDHIEAAARAAHAHEFIVGLPSGYETLVGERGMRLSGGERQRISLARAFLRDAPILVLDEPTSSVDIRTEALIMEAMEELMRGRTTFIIAHRLSTLETCDVRLHIRGGKVARAVADGSTTPLLGAAAGT